MSIEPAKKLPGDTLTVVIRDDAPLAMCDGSPTYRSVQIKLTKEQRQEIALNATYQVAGKNYYERIERCFIETKKEFDPSPSKEQDNDND